MEKYNYLENLKEDIKTYIKENNITDLDEDSLYDDMFIEDSITGNGSGSYYCNAWKAEEALSHNLDLLQEACEEFGSTPDLSNPEACDVTIRCYLLEQALHEVIEEMEEENNE